MDNPGVVFTYGDTIYAPTTEVIPDDLMIHEMTHEAQQKEMGVEKWWDEYLSNWKFRLGVETEAYHNQYKSLQVLTRDHRRFITKQLAKALCSPLYGDVVDYPTALRLVKKGME